MGQVPVTLAPELPYIKRTETRIMPGINIVFHIPTVDNRIDSKYGLILSTGQYIQYRSRGGELMIIKSLTWLSENGEPIKSTGRIAMVGPLS